MPDPISLPTPVVQSSHQPGPDTSGWVHSWDLSTGVDGPGTRFTLFTAGCPLRCLYCANPDTWRHTDGTRMTVTEVLTRIRRYRAALRAGGGVTISGGEPLSQPRFTAAVLHACRQEGLHTALDTSGYLGNHASESLLDDVSLVLLDIKSFDPDIYRLVTGQELAPTLRFAERLAERAMPVWVRFVLVPGLTDSAENVDGLAGFVAGLPNVERVDVLAYHHLGAAKYAGLGLHYPLEGVPEPGPDDLEAARKHFSDRGLTVT